MALYVKEPRVSIKDYRAEGYSANHSAEDSPVRYYQAITKTQDPGNQNA
jgi:hypothetical protein